MEIKYKDTDYERVLVGEATLQIIGDVGMLVPAPIMCVEDNKTRLYYLAKVSQAPGRVPSTFHTGGQFVSGLLSLGVAELSIIDYAPVEFERVLHLVMWFATGNEELAKSKVYYKQVARNSWDIKDIHDITIQNEINAHMEDTPEDVIIDARDRMWYDKFFSTMYEMNQHLNEVRDMYMTEQEKKAVELHKKMMQAQYGTGEEGGGGAVPPTTLQ